MPKTAFRILIIGILLFPAFGYGGVADWWTDIYGRDAGNTTLSFLTLPASASLLSRGCVSSAGAMDATDLPQFTANSALAKGDQFAISHIEWLMGLRTEYAGAALPLPDAGTFGFYFRAISTGKFEYARTIDETVSDPTYLEYTLGTSFARSLMNEMLSVGVNLSYVESRLDTDVGRTVAAGADIRAQPFPYLSARGYILNAGFPVRYGTSNISNPLPIQIGTSINYTPLDQNTSSFWGVTLGLGAQKTADEPLVLGASTELKTSHWVLWRAGYEHMAGYSPSIGGLSYGLGVRVGNYGMDAAYKVASEDFGSIWAVNIRMQAEERKRKTADDYFSAAQYQFTRNNFEKTAKLAVKALKLDPNHWKAHALLSKARAEMLRSEKREIALIYSGNNRGMVVPYPPSPDALGGLSRQAALINSLRSAFPVSFCIDVGNGVNKTSHPLRSRLTLEYYDHVNYDILAPGEGEIDYGIARFLGASTSILPFVITNIDKMPGLSLVKSAVVEHEGYRFFVVNTIATNALKNNDASWTMSSPVAEIKKQLSGNDAKRSHVKLAVVHENWEEITKLAQNIPDLDIIISGSLDQRFTAPMKIGSTLILSAGSEGKFLGCLTMRFDEEKNLLSTENKLYPITQEIIPDSIIENKTNLVTATIELEKAEIIPGTESAAGVFPFVSDRNGAPQVFLKAVEKMAEFPLGNAIFEYRKPTFNARIGQAVFLHGKPELKNSCIELVDLKTFRRKSLAKGKNVTEALFSPSGDYLYFIAGDSGSDEGSIYKTRKDMNDMIQVIPSDSSVRKDLVFSPDGATVLYSSNKEGRWQVFAIDTSVNTSPMKLTVSESDNVRPRFSPDGKYIAYLSDQKSFGGKMDLWLIDRITSEHKQITFNANVDDYCWSSDSRTIIFSSGVNVLDLNKVDISNGRFDKLMLTAMIKDWSDTSPRFVHYKSMRKVVFTRVYADGSKALFWYDLESGNEQRIVKSGGSDWLE